MVLKLSMMSAFLCYETALESDFLRGPGESYKWEAETEATWGLPGKLFDATDYDVLQDNLLVSSA